MRVSQLLYKYVAGEYAGRLTKAMLDEIYTTFMQFDVRDEIGAIIKAWNERYTKEMQGKPITAHSRNVMMVLLRDLEVALCLGQLMAVRKFSLDRGMNSPNHQYTSIRVFSVPATPDISINVIAYTDVSSYPLGVRVEVVIG